jgi:hypothetical protein
MSCGCSIPWGVAAAITPVGLPQIANIRSGIADIIERLETLGFNYGKQFGPVMEKIRVRCSSSEDK